MTPPNCPVTGKHLRWLLLLAVLSYSVYFLVHGLAEPPSARTVHICDTDNLSQLTECNSTDDVTTCAGLTDADGNAAACIASACGYRLFPHFDVSIAGASEPYDAADATAVVSFLSVVSIIYSLVPYAVAFAYLVSVLATGDLVALTRLAVFVAISIPNELVFKRLVKQYRPLGSCLYFASWGMPSGHAATSIGLLTYLLLELFVYHPNILCGLTCQKKEHRYSFKLGYGWQRQTANNEQGPGTSCALEGSADNAVVLDMNDGDVGVSAGDGSSPNDGMPPDPRSEYRESSPTAASAPAVVPRRWLALCYCLVLFPVPFSRVYLHDHLRAQVLAGAGVGAAIAALWYLGVVRNCGLRVLDWRTSAWGTWWGLTLGREEGFFGRHGG